MMRVNGRALVIERPAICTIEEYISGEVRDELRLWQYFMMQYLNDIRPQEAMKHDSYKRVNRRIRQIKHGVHV